LSPRVTLSNTSRPRQTGILTRNILRENELRLLVRCGTPFAYTPPRAPLNPPGLIAMIVQPWHVPGNDEMGGEEGLTLTHKSDRRMVRRAVAWNRRRFSSGGHTHSLGGRFFPDSGWFSLAQGGGGHTGHFRDGLSPGGGARLPVSRYPRDGAPARRAAGGQPDRVFFGAPAPKNTRCMPSAEKSSNSFRLCASLCLRVFVVKTVHPDPLLPAEMWVMESPPPGQSDGRFDAFT